MQVAREHDIENRPEGREGVSPVGIWGKSMAAEGTASAKPQGKNILCCMLSRVAPGAVVGVSVEQSEMRAQRAWGRPCLLASAFLCLKSFAVCSA